LPPNGGCDGEIEEIPGSTGKTGKGTATFSSCEEWRTGLREFLDCIDELVAVSFVESDRQREHAALREPDAAREEIEVEEVAQSGVASFGVFL
jgi:hypothetical protein